jgi:sugar-phosphatase
VDLDHLRAFLFDMDGTLVDSDAAVERAWATWADRYEVDPALAISIAHGKPATATARLLRPDLDEARIAEAAARQLALQYDDLDDVAPTIGAHRLIEAIDRRGFDWAVVTSADFRLATARLDAVAIHPRVLVTIDDVAVGKPDPEGYLLAAKRLGVSPSRCLTVEDTETGLAAARAAGTMTAAIKGLDADLRLSDLGMLADLVEALPGANGEGSAR